MKKTIKKLKNNEFVKHFLTLLSGSVLAQAILFAITPILTRLYSEEMFGVYMVFASAVMIAKIISTLRLELAIVIAPDEKEAVNIVFLATIINFLVNSLFFTLILIFQPAINKLIGDEKLGWYLYLLPFSAFLTGFFQTLNYWNNRQKKYKNISAALIGKNTGMSTWNITFGSIGLKNLGLIPGQIFGLIISVTILSVISFKQIFKLTRFVSYKEMFRQLKKYSDIPKYNTSINIVANLGNEAPIFLLTGFFGAATVGLYGMANRLLGTPTDLIGKSIGQVFFRKASEIYNNKQDIYSFLKKTYINLFKVGLFIFIPALIISPFMKYVLGTAHDWTATGYFMMLIIPLSFSKLLNNPVSSIFTILNEQKKITFYYIAILIIRIISIVVGYVLFKNVYATVFLFVISGLLFNIVLIFLYLRMTKLKTEEFAHTNDK